MRALLHLLGAARRLRVRVMTPVERARSALEAAGSRRSGRDWQCPAHQDHKASLSVSEDRDGRAVLHCHAGCETWDVLAALRLDWPDLFPEGRNGKAALVDAYDYTDEHGRLLYQAVRYFPKGFKRRRPDGRGGWTWKLGDTRLVLYRLPRVLAAVEAGLPVYVVEGEKDVHAIEGAGATATTVLGGVSGRWLPEHSRLLAKTRVVVVADDDPPAGSGPPRLPAPSQGLAAGSRWCERPSGKTPPTTWPPAGPWPTCCPPTRNPSGPRLALGRRRAPQNPQNPQKPRRPGSRRPPSARPARRPPSRSGHSRGGWPTTSRPWRPPPRPRPTWPP
jgi:hypothetical protein